jgi:(5-formylfuran-3-yl)methyl phosphate synthase
MTRFLASVRNAEEAQAVLAAGADIVDLKDPAKGALGAVDFPIIKACVAAIAGRAPVSATVGDLPMDRDCVHDAVLAASACGVDDVKLGVQRNGDPHACFARLRAHPPRAGLILVFFADAMPNFDPVAAALAAGAHGLMLDTAGKQAGSLLDHMAIGDIAGFVEDGRKEGLMVGVAGSLRAEHVAPLLALSPDVIGFRGALCHGARRDAGLDPVACSQIRALIPAETPRPDAQIGAPRAAVVC